MNNKYISLLGWSAGQQQSTLSANSRYELARHPEVLEKLQAEIDQLPLGDDDRSNEETKK